MRRLVIFLGLNALVSATVTLSVLWLWDVTHRDAVASLPTRAASTPAPGEELPSGAGATALPGASGGAAATTAGPSNATSGLATITPTVYIVRPGDTLGKVALEFAVSVEELMAANGLTDPNVLDVGQALSIPVGATHTPSIPANTPQASPSTPAPAGSATGLPSATPIPGGSGAPQLAIRGVIGAGDPAQERVTIVNVDGDVSLAGWTLHDTQGNAFFFPALSLFQGGAVTVHTRTGADTVTDLYWNQTAPVWQSGEQVTLVDPTGTPHTTFVVP